MIEAFALGWFAVAGLQAWLCNGDFWYPEMTAKFPRGVPALMQGHPIGCDYREPNAHLRYYTSSAQHLCTYACLHEPPEER